MRVSTREGGSDGTMGALVDSSNIGYGKGCIVGVSGGGDGGDDYCCRDGFIDGLDVGDGAGGSGGLINGDSVGNLVGKVIMDVVFF